MSSTIQIPPTELERIFGERLLALLDQQTREQLIKDALAWLTSPQKDQWGNLDRKRASPLQEALHRAFDIQATTLAREMIDGDETVKEALRGLIRDAVLKATVEGEARNAIVDKIAAALARGMTER